MNPSVTNKLWLETTCHYIPLFTALLPSPSCSNSDFLIYVFFSCSSRARLTTVTHETNHFCSDTVLKDVMVESKIHHTELSSHFQNDGDAYNSKRSHQCLPNNTDCWFYAAIFTEAITGECRIHSVDLNPGADRCS